MTFSLLTVSGFFITGGFNGLTQASFVTALRALPAIVIGGLDSLVGAVVGSLIIGLTQGYIAYYQISIENLIGISFGSGFSLLAPYLIMFVILIIRPDGLFGKEEVEPCQTYRITFLVLLTIIQGDKQLPLQNDLA